MKSSLIKGMYLEGNSLLIVSERLSDFISILTGFTGKKREKKTMGFALFPCIIILRNLIHPMTKQWINHEKIHIRQYLESLGLFWLFSQFEYIYARIFLHYSKYEAYRYEAVEQEAYLNQENSNYLDTRKVFSTIKYFKHKTSFHTDSDYHVVIRKKK